MHHRVAHEAAALAQGSLRAEKFTRSMEPFQNTLLSRVVCMDAA